ncbi:DUF3667 domain-containing protein [Patiriisocius marinus]|uniref:DUF3667 domain-containing protein n=1 Tax=Patiriisocius marinus TaxID=1397112 RepID=UPI00232CA04D|nr:DUF3667 domain-containing protein [Patiriisocius marinus]
MSDLTNHEVIEVETKLESNKDTKTVSSNSRRHFKYRSNECLNCSQPLDLSDRYCPYCSQLNSTKPLSLKDFIEEFFSSFISYDSRLRFTVKDLLFKPGTITRKYVNGKRLKYTNPFRFFLSVSIIYFLVYGMINFFNPEVGTPFFDVDGNKNDTTNTNINTSNFYLDDENTGDLTVAIEQLESNPATAKWAEKLKKTDSIRKAEIRDLKDDIKIIDGDTINDHDYTKRVAMLSSENNIQAFFNKFEIMQDFYRDTKISSSLTALDSLSLPNTRTNNWLYSKNKTIERIEDDPYSFIQFVLSKTPVFLFFFAPFFALFFWLLYARRPFTYMEHLVLIFHIFSFVFLVMLILSIPDIFLDISFVFAIFFGLVAPFYFYKALRNFYKQSRTKTIIKFVILNFVFMIGASTAASLFFLATAATY